MTGTTGSPRQTVLIYARSARLGASLARQVQALQAYSTDRGWSPSGVLAEVAPRGPSPAALGELRAAPALLVQDLTRLGRDHDAALSVYTALVAAGARVFLASGSHPSPNPTLDAHIRAMTHLLAEEARRQHSEAVRHGLARRRELRA